MPTPLYDKVVALVVSAAGSEKGPGIVERQLQSKGISLDSFGPAELKIVVIAIRTATKLYCPDPEKRAAFEAKLNAMAG